VQDLVWKKSQLVKVSIWPCVCKWWEMSVDFKRHSPLLRGSLSIPNRRSASNRLYCNRTLFASWLHISRLSFVCRSKFYVPGIWSCVRCEETVRNKNLRKFFLPRHKTTTTSTFLSIELPYIESRTVLSTENACAVDPAITGTCTKLRMRFTRKITFATLDVVITLFWVEITSVVFSKL